MINSEQLFGTTGYLTL